MLKPSVCFIVSPPSRNRWAPSRFSCLLWKLCNVGEILASILSRSTCFWRVTLDANKGAARLNYPAQTFKKRRRWSLNAKLRFDVSSELLFKVFYTVKHCGFVTLYLVWWCYFFSVTWPQRRIWFAHFHFSTSPYLSQTVSYINFEASAVGRWMPDDGGCSSVQHRG